MCLAALVPAVGQQPTEIPEEPQPMPAPALPYYDFEACPFEGCTYREWKARKAVTVFDTWKSNRRVIAKVSPGESVTGLNGVVITSKPGTIRMDRDMPNLKLKKGDTILTYTYVGEGFAAAWDQFYLLDAHLAAADPGLAQYRAPVRERSPKPDICARAGINPSGAREDFRRNFHCVREIAGEIG